MKGLARASVERIGSAEGLGVMCSTILRRSGSQVTKHLTINYKSQVNTCVFCFDFLLIKSKVLLCVPGWH